ncbi:MAG: anaerobic ribonucleoside-triphosphate reductase activating protein [Sporomusaceae bacterium]|nr:anaerobic ribonucleoside-triphosphate reductase activating protein [Sporomusaceae bacterium]
MEIKVAGIIRESIVDGPGLRLVIFTQGCPHHCDGCHNPETHDPDGGKSMDSTELIAMVETARLIRGVTFSGGEPFLQAAALASIAAAAKRRGLDIVTYTGFLYEHLLTLADAGVKALLAQTDILVDGPFIKAERDLRLAFCGSRNQRLIDVPKSLAAGRAVLWQDPYQVISV